MMLVFWYAVGFIACWTGIALLLSMLIGAVTRRLKGSLPAVPPKPATGEGTHPGSSSSSPRAVEHQGAPHTLRSRYSTAHQFEDGEVERTYGREGQR